MLWRTAWILVALLLVAGGVSAQFVQELGFPRPGSVHTVVSLSDSSREWSPTYLAYFNGPEFAFVAALDGRGGETEIAAVVGMAGTSDEGTYLPSAPTIRVRPYPLPAARWHLGSLPEEPVVRGLEQTIASAYRLSEESFERVLGALSAYSEASEALTPNTQGSKETVSSFLSSLSEEVAEAAGAELLVGVMVGPQLATGSLVRLQYPQDERLSLWRELADLSHTPGLDYRVEMTDRDQRRVIEELDGGKTLEAVRLAVPLWTDAHQAWCYLGEVSDGAAHGLGTLYLEPTCAGSGTLTGSFEAGLLQGLAVENSPLGMTAKGEIKDGRRDGPWMRFARDGVVFSSEVFRDGQPAAGPVIIGEGRYPLLNGLGPGVSRQFVGHRDEEGNVEGKWFPTGFDRQVAEGRTWRFDGQRLVDIHEGWGWGIYTMKASGPNGPMVADGPCQVSLEDGTRMEGNCAEVTSAEGVTRLLSGSCTIHRTDGMTLQGNCENGRLAGTAYLTGGDAGQQYVDIRPDGSFEYSVPNDWQRLWDGIGNVLEDTWELAIDPETYVNPNVWVETVQRVLAEANRAIERNEELAEILEAACGPDTGGCTLVEIPLGEEDNGYTPDTPDHEPYSNRVSRSPAGDGTVISVASGPRWSGPPIITANARYSALDVTLQSIGVAVELYLMNRLQGEMDGVTARWMGRLEPGQLVELDCGVRSARLQTCWERSGDPPLVDPSWHIIRHTVAGPLPLDALYPEPEWVREMREQQILEQMPEWARRRIEEGGNRHPLP